MSDVGIPPVFSTAQRFFILSLLGDGFKNADILIKFREKYPSFCEPYDAPTLKKYLGQRISTLRKDNKSEISLYSGKSSVLVSDPDYLLGYLQDLLLRTPDVEVVSEGIDASGNPYVRKKSNRSDICKIVQLILAIDGGVVGSVSYRPAFSQAEFMLSEDTDVAS